jgi:cyclophilin family peptidyl-prolyl cis-trans isomerase
VNGNNKNTKGGALKQLALDAGPTMVVIEMTSLEMMPHSVYTFLEMVSGGLLNGCSFILNALHVLKAAPLPYDGTSASDKAREFLDSGLNSVAFREYNPEFPHLKHTVGFAADGSPSFYINTEDNSEIHVGDPCFGKIVSGFDTIERLEKMPTRNGIWFEHRIGIKEAVVL